MSIDIQSTYESDKGIVYEFRERFIFVPTGIPDQFETSVENEVEAVRAAIGINRETPPGVAVFEDGDARDGLNRAQLWAEVVATIEFDQPLEWTPTQKDDCHLARIPAVVVAAGNAAVAAYLATLDFTNSEISDTLNVGNRTVSQYISDFQKGQR